MLFVNDLYNEIIFSPYKWHLYTLVRLPYLIQENQTNLIIYFDGSFKQRESRHTSADGRLKIAQMRRKMNFSFFSPLKEAVLLAAACFEQEVLKSQIHV